MAGTGYKTLASNTLWLSIGNGARYFVMALASVVVGRVLGTQAYGEYGVISSTLVLFSLVADSGMSSTAARYIGAYSGLEPQKAARIASLSFQVMGAAGLVLGTLVCLTGPWISVHWLDNSGLGFPLALAAPSIMFSSASGGFVGHLRGVGEFRMLSKVEIACSGAIGIFLVLGALAGGLEGALLGFTISNLIRTLALLSAVRASFRNRAWRMEGLTAWTEARVMVKYSLPAMVAGLMVAPTLWWVRIVLARQGGGYHEAGLFTAAMQWQVPLTFLSSVLSSVALPAMSHLFETGEREGLGQVASAISHVVALTLGPVSVSMILLSDLLIGVFGIRFADAVLPMVMVVVASYLNSSVNIVGTVIQAAEKMWIGLALNGLWGATLVAGTYVLAPRFGASGAAGAFLISYTIHFMMSLIAAQRILGRRFLSRAVGIHSGVIGSALCAALALGDFYPWAFALAAVTGILCSSRISWKSLPEAARQRLSFSVVRSGT